MSKLTFLGRGYLRRRPAPFVERIAKRLVMGHALVRRERLLLKETPIRIIEISVADGIGLDGGDEIESRQTTIEIELVNGFQLRMLRNDRANVSLQVKTVQVVFRGTRDRTEQQHPTGETENRISKPSPRQNLHAVHSSPTNYRAFMRPRISDIIPSRSASALFRSLMRASRS